MCRAYLIHQKQEKITLICFFIKNFTKNNSSKKIKILIFNGEVFPLKKETRIVSINIFVHIKKDLKKKKKSKKVWKETKPVVICRYYDCLQRKS